MARSVAGRGVLTYLAARQATETSAFQDSQPGKIMHETRGGEMAAMKEIPFGLYYGGVDTTPLFVALAGAYLRRTDDVALIGALWPALKRAIAWVEGYGDSNGDGLIDYQRGAETGLANQGWKDSEDSVFHADGRFPVGPIALVEVQGYAYAAYQAMAADGAAAWASRAPTRWSGAAPKRCAGASKQRFWMEDAGFYGIAVDGEGALCTPLTSNAGHLLFTGLPSADARRAGDASGCCPTSFDSGWGLRTLAVGHQPLQPDELPQRLGLAARHQPLRRRHGPLRRAQRRGAGDGRPLPRLAALRPAHAGAAVRLRRAAPASRRSPIRSPACRRPGRRARCS